jgi:hypothetical protein
MNGSIRLYSGESAEEDCKFFILQSRAGELLAVTYRENAGHDRWHLKILQNTMEQVRRSWIVSWLSEIQIEPPPTGAGVALNWHETLLRTSKDDPAPYLVQCLKWTGEKPPEAETIIGNLLRPGSPHFVWPEMMAALEQEEALSRRKALGETYRAISDMGEF